MPANIRKLLYPVFLAALLLTVLLTHRAGVRPVYLLLFALTLFVAARLVNYWIKRLMWLNWGSYTGDIAAMAHNNLGAIGLEIRQLDEANTHLRQAIALDAGYAKPYYNLAVIAAWQNDPEASAQHLAEARRRGFTNFSYDQFLTKLPTEYADFNVSANQWERPDQSGNSQ